MILYHKKYFKYTKLKLRKYLYNAVSIYRPVAQFWLERCIDIAEVDGSSPFGSTIFIVDLGNL